MFGQKKSQDSFLALPRAFQLHGHLDPTEEQHNKTLRVVFWAVVEWISVSESGLLSGIVPRCFGAYR